MAKRKLLKIEKDELIQNLISQGAGIQLDEDLLVDDFEQFLIYNRSEKKCFCTACNQWSDMPSKKTKAVSIGCGCSIGLWSAHHKETTVCPYCGRQVTALAEGRSRRSISEQKRFIQINDIGENEVLAIGITINSKFMDPYCTYIVNPEEGCLEYSYSYDFFIRLTPGEVRKFWFKLTYNGLNDCNREWIETSRTELEPTYQVKAYYGSFNEPYILKDYEVAKLRDTYLKYAVRSWEKNVNDYDGFVRYLVLYSEHPNTEYLMSGGFAPVIIKRCLGQTSNFRINWKSNNLKKMLGLKSKEEINILSFSDYSDEIAKFKQFRDKVKGFKIHDYEHYRKYAVDNFIEVQQLTGMSCDSIDKYVKCNANLIMYRDYLRMSQKLEYDLTDSAIYKPNDLKKMHDRVTSIINAMVFEEQSKKYQNRYKQLIKRFYYRDEELGLQIVVPQSAADIRNEGKILHHCVGGYAQRHIEGKTNILFIRKIRTPLRSFYTIEVDNNGVIQQFYGYENNKKFRHPKQIIKFVERFNNNINRKKVNTA